MMKEQFLIFKFGILFFRRFNNIAKFEAFRSFCTKESGPGTFFFVLFMFLNASLSLDMLTSVSKMGIKML